MISYSANDPKGWCGDPKRGAALGRGGDVELETEEERLAFTGTLYICKVEIDSQGYDQLGTYWGHGRTLYWVHDEEGLVQLTLRAGDVAGAEEQVRNRYPNAKYEKGATEECPEIEEDNEDDDD